MSGNTFTGCLNPAWLRDLEAVKQELEKKKKQLEAVKAEKKKSLKWADQVAKFFEHFEDRAIAASLAEQQLLLLKMVERIVVDRERKVVRTYAWMLPKGKVTQVEDLLASESADQKRVFLSSVSPTRTESLLRRNLQSCLAYASA